MIGIQRSGGAGFGTNDRKLNFEVMFTSITFDEPSITNMWSGAHVSYRCDLRLFVYRRDENNRPAGSRTVLRRESSAEHGANRLLVETEKAQTRPRLGGESTLSATAPVNL